MSVRRISRIFLLLCVCLLCGGILQAQPKDGNGLRPRKGMAGKKGMRRLPPGSRLDALERMSPAQQDRFVDSLPPARRDEARRWLNNWRNMTPEERTRARRTLGEFRGLAPERQRRIRTLFGHFNSLPSDRQPILRSELTELRRLDPEERRTRMNSDDFRNRYSPEERRLLTDLTEALPGQFPHEEDEPEDQEN